MSVRDGYWFKLRYERRQLSLETLRSTVTEDLDLLGCARTLSTPPFKSLQYAIVGRVSTMILDRVIYLKGSGSVTPLLRGSILTKDSESAGSVGLNLPRASAEP